MNGGDVEKRGKRRAFALFMVLVAVLLLVGAGALLAIHIQIRLALVLDQHRNLRAQNLLDSGFAVAAATLRDDYGFEGELEVELDGGRVQMEIERVPGNPGLRQIEMRATYRGEIRRARGRLRLPSPGAEPDLYGLEPVALGAGDR